MIKNIINIVLCLIPISKVRKYIRGFILGYINECYPSKELENEIIIYTKNGKILKNKRVKNLEIEFKGKNSKLILHEPYNFLGKCKIIFTDNNTVEIRSTSFMVKDLSIYTMTQNSEVNIGENLSCNGCSIYFDVPNQNILIGNDCMFAFNINIWPNDGHAILDNKTLKPNTEIADNCIIGMNSITNRKLLELNTIYAGAPAVPKKTGITWVRENTYYYDKQHYEV